MAANGRKKFVVASHSYKLTGNGFVILPLELKVEDSKNASKHCRRNSNEFFSPSLPNIILDMVREFSDLNKVSVGSARTTKPRDYLKSQDRKALEQKLIKLCDLAEEVLKKEPRCVPIPSPCIVFGDIHGNLHDLMIYERLFWKKGPHLEPYCYLFLGDYVDRGMYSLEVFMYLIASKVQSPSQFHLLRGNHEIREVNRNFTFYKELIEKLGTIAGPQMWERINRVFDCLPNCAVIDERIFCAHGGIPSAGSAGACKLSDLLTIPCPLPKPEDKSIAWECMWNDPVTDQVSPSLQLLRHNNAQFWVDSNSEKRTRLFVNKPVHRLQLICTKMDSFSIRREVQPFITLKMLLGNSSLRTDLVTSSELMKLVPKDTCSITKEGLLLCSPLPSMVVTTRLERLLLIGTKFDR